MGTKIGNLFEEHIEKIVLAVVGLVCIWLFITRVLISPNAVSYDNQKFSPSEIDKYILQQHAKELEYTLKQPPELKSVYVSKLNGPLEPNDPVRQGIYGDLQAGFDGLLASAINGVDTRWSIPLPPAISTEISGGRHYALPLIDGVIGEVEDVAVEHIRAAAYVPTLLVTEEVPYENAAPAPDDIDLVTVEAKFDVKQLYERFKESFTGIDVPEQWRDPCLAVPVFAAVQLQRQELLDDGSWSDWQDVPRSKIDHRKRMFEIIEDIESLPPGGIKVRLLQFNDPEVRMDLLQPQAYQIASANEEWFPPSLHAKFLELQSKEKMEVKREEREAKKQEEERLLGQRLDGRRSRLSAGRLGTARAGGAYYEGYGSAEGLYGTSRARPRRGRPGSRTGRTDMGLYDDTGLYGDTGLAGGRGRRRPRTRGLGGLERDIETEYMMPIGGRGISRGPSTNDVYYEFEDISLTPRTDLAKWREPLVFWAHDDTVQPGKSYRYRIRLGVFNPVAGTNQVPKQHQSFTKKVILWSKFSDITEPVSIPGRLYFFAKDIQEAAKKVTVQVSKYMLGYWYSEDFPVRYGEVIGKVVESEPPQPKERFGRRGLGWTSGRSRGGLRTARTAYVAPQEQITEPESIDYSTGAVLVDAVAVNDWSGAGYLRPRLYFDMLYSFDGTNIEHMPIKPGNWSADLLAIYSQINKLQREPKEPLRAWDSRVGGRRRRLPTPGLEEYDMMEEEYYDEEYDLMMEEMMGMRRY
ncbi:MAG: hypothetical protein ACE5NM_04755 [Sedimentisphaerales bacterium]